MKYSFSSFGSPITCLVQSPVVDVIAIGLLNGTILLHNIKLDENIISLKQEGCVTSISFRTGITCLVVYTNVVRSVQLTNDVTQQMTNILWLLLVCMEI